MAVSCTVRSHRTRSEYLLGLRISIGQQVGNWNFELEVVRRAPINQSANTANIRTALIASPVDLRS